jgi:hypothetical protein
MTIRILYRDFDIDGAERAAISTHFPDSTDSRMDIRKGDVVIGRYSVLPYYAEQERDIKRVGARMLVTHGHHRWIAEMEWAQTLRGFTPKTWFRAHDLPMDAKGAFVVKGVTNSRKHLWNTHMFARTRADVGVITARLLQDTLIGLQDIVVREYHPLITYMHGFGGVPITKEYRFFMAGARVLASGYYWASHAFDVASICNCGHTESEHSGDGRCCFITDGKWCVCRCFVREAASVPRVVDVRPPQEFIERVASQLDAVPLYVLDVAQTIDGDWIVVELNDLQMSGLALCDPDELYRNLAEHLKEKTGGPP